MAVYDAFMFFNEFDLLSVRLAEHDPFVDFFVLIQADRTFSGVSKPLHFLKADPRFVKYAHKIIVVDVPLLANPGSAWDNEFIQRQAAFSAVAYQPDDILYLSDVDEIISRHCWDYLLNRMQNENLIGVWLRMFYYFVNLELIDHPWALAKLIKAKVFLGGDVSGNEIRCSPAAVTTPFPCGWHFSYLMTVDQIIQKIKAYSHQENNTAEFKDPKNIEQAMQSRKDLFGRDMSFKTVPMDKTWPKEMLTSDRWKEFVIKTDFKVWGREIFLEIQSQLKENVKKILQPLFRPFRVSGNKKDSYSEFGSETFEKLIMARPKGQDSKEWRRMIEFLEFVLPKIDAGFSAKECAELFIKLVSSLKPNSKVVALGNTKGRGVVFASRAAVISGSEIIVVDSSQTENKTDEVAEFKKNVTLFSADNVRFLNSVGSESISSWNQGPVDFIFAETSSKSELSPSEIEAWKKVLTPQSVVWLDKEKAGICANGNLLFSRN